MASPIDRHSFSPRMQLGVLSGRAACVFCGEAESHENHQTDEQAKQAALDKHLTDTAREIAPKLRSLVGEDQQTVVTIALELARARVTLRRVDPPYGVDAESFRRAAETLGQEAALVLGEAHRRGVRPSQIKSATITYAGVCACGHAMDRHQRGEACEICECPLAKRRVTGELVRHPLRDEAMGVRRERQVVCTRCERLCPELGECPCSKTCCQNGPRLGCPVHGEALRSHLEETEKRHRSMASPEAEAAARRDHGDGDGRIPGRAECPSNECQIRQTCTGHANCTKQYARATSSIIEETLEAAYWTFDAARSGAGEWKGRTLTERDAFKLAVRRAAIGEAALAELSRPGPAHPKQPCIGCNPTRPCFNGWKACQRESGPIGSVLLHPFVGGQRVSPGVRDCATCGKLASDPVHLSLTYTHQTIVPKGDPVGVELTHGELDDIRAQVAGYSSDSAWRKLLDAFDKERAKAKANAYSFEVISVPTARGPILDQIAEERIRQDTKWGGPKHDDTHERGEWLDFIREHLERAKKQAGQCPSSAAMDAYRHELVVIAALAVAAIETHDRAAKPKEKP